MATRGKGRTQRAGSIDAQKAAARKKFVEGGVSRTASLDDVFSAIAGVKASLASLDVHLRENLSTIVLVNYKPKRKR